MCEADRLDRPIEFEPESTSPKNFDRPIESAAPPATSDPTRETYLGWSDAYDFFNASCSAASCRRASSPISAAGNSTATSPVIGSSMLCVHQAAHRIDEIAINPFYLREQLTEHALSVLAHEMAHLKRHRLIQPPPTPGYHDKQWAAIMVDIGLIPSTTGEPGGKTTGQKVRHYIIVGGRFSLAAQELMRRGSTYATSTANSRRPTANNRRRRTGDTEIRLAVITAGRCAERAATRARRPLAASIASLLRISGGNRIRLICGNATRRCCRSRPLQACDP